MEAAKLYETFEQNLLTIQELIRSGLEVRTMPYNVSIPLELRLLCDVLNQANLNFELKTEGLAALDEFIQQFMQVEKTAMEAMRQILENKRSYMKTSEGTVLTKEMLYRRLEFFKETAHTLQVMDAQRKLHSPKQFNYPNLK